MKKLITLLLILSLSFTLFSCVDGNGGGGEGGSEGGGSGDGGSAIGSCPRGGEHDYVNNVCTKCNAYYDPDAWT